MPGSTTFLMVSLSPSNSFVLHQHGKKCDFAMASKDATIMGCDVTASSPPMRGDAVDVPPIAEVEAVKNAKTKY